MNVPWEDIGLAVNEIQEGICLETWVLRRVLGSPSPDGSIQEPISYSFKNYTFSSDVKEIQEKPGNELWQSLGADYICISSAQSWIDQGINVFDDRIRETLKRDLADIRGYRCSIVESRLTGKNPDGFNFFTLGAKRIENEG